MKKTIALILTLCTLLCTLTACHSRRDYYQSLASGTGDNSGQATREPIIEIVTNESGEAVTTPDGEPVTEIITEPVTLPHSGSPIEPSVGVNPYVGMTGGELKDLYFDSFRAQVYDTNLNTPYYYILKNIGGVIAFNKLTGDITTLCKDPLCDHKSCVYGKKLHCVLVSEDRLYTVSDYGDGIGLFSFDYQFNDPKKLLMWDNEEDAPIDDNIFYWNGKLYYKVYYLVNGETLQRVRVYDVASGKDNWLEPDKTMHFDNLRLVYEGYLYYWRTGDHSIWRYDLRTGEDICLLAEEDALNAADGDRMLTLRAVLPGSKTLCLCIIGIVGKENVWKYYYYDIDTKEMKRTYGMDNPLGEYTISLKDHINDDAFKDDPYYDFYLNDAVNNPFAVSIQYGGDLYYNTDDQADTKMLLHATVDGIPVGFSGLYDHDGKCLYIAFRTYKGYANKYNPGYRQPSNKDETLYLHDGYAIIDIENRKILTICQDNVEYEWYLQ